LIYQLCYNLLILNVINSYFLDIQNDNKIETKKYNIDDDMKNNYLTNIYFIDEDEMYDNPNLHSEEQDELAPDSILLVFDLLYIALKLLFFFFFFKYLKMIS
jgi:hypothetical protein